jgi:lipopolysaccharide transport system ATP-binding protein
MSDIAIKVEDLGKLYRLGQVGMGTVKHDFQRWVAKIKGKEDPFAKIGEVNDRAQKGESGYVWALKDVNFEIKKGEAVGIIGKNGAGKSTLLKILSRVTKPTTGNVKAKGRIASLLEVGTGFHPDLSGRENIFLNGAILGMKKIEIKRKFDEIVDFSGVERYIDTPVKRYSSGMYVRLAFAVAAFLEQEILLVDEVLAVGDAEFQQKCLGKMEDVSLNQGRTVLFVTHNLAAIRTFCSKSICFSKGSLLEMGSTSDVIANYLKKSSAERTHIKWDYENAPGNFEAKFLEARVYSQEENEKKFRIDRPLFLEFSFFREFTTPTRLDITFHLIDEFGQLVFVGSSGISQVELDGASNFSRGKISIGCTIPANLLHEGSYSISRLLLVQNKGSVLYEYKYPLSFDMIELNKGFGWQANKEGVIRPVLDWKLIS